MNFLNKYLGGHITIGKITIYGFNAMNCAINIRTKKYGFICIRLPIPVPHWKYVLCMPAPYFYISPVGTPWAATFIIGGGKRMKRDRLLAPIRRYRLGLYYDYWNDQYKSDENRRLNNLI